MLKHITYTFPDNTPTSQNFFKQLIELLTDLPNARIQKDGSITITASKPQGSFPITIFAQSDIPFPQLNLGSSQDLSLLVGNFRINSEVGEIDNRDFEKVLSKHDSLGAYFELHFSNQILYRLSINEVVKRLKGHVVRIDHTGINIPSELISKESWQQFIQKVSLQANLYKYPTTEDWPFVLPATEGENATDITHFPVGREPKFELVYDIYSSVPTIQIDIETDLSRAQVEQLFPAPYGISFPDLADFFRTVYVHHEWLGLAIRFDIRFKNENPDGDWETGKWLVNDGGRIRPHSL